MAQLNRSEMLCCPWGLLCICKDACTEQRHGTALLSTSSLPHNPEDILDVKESTFED